MLKYEILFSLRKMIAIVIPKYTYSPTKHPHLQTMAPKMNMHVNRTVFCIPSKFYLRLWHNLNFDKNNIKFLLLCDWRHRQMLNQIPNSGLFILHRPQHAYKHTEFTLLHQICAWPAEKQNYSEQRANGCNGRTNLYFGFRYLCIE